MNIRTAIRESARLIIFHDIVANEWAVSKNEAAEYRSLDWNQRLDVALSNFLHVEVEEDEEDRRAVDLACGQASYRAALVGDEHGAPRRTAIAVWEWWPDKAGWLRGRMSLEN